MKLLNANVADDAIDLLIESGINVITIFSNIWQPDTQGHTTNWNMGRMGGG